MRSNKDKKLAILRILDVGCKKAFREFLEKKAEEEAHLAGYKQWEREHPDDGVGCFSMNKWNPESATNQRCTAESVYKDWQELCDYALQTLVE